MTVNKLRIGYLPPVTLAVFVTLKLSGTVDWPWVWVLSPIWGAFALLGFILWAVFKVKEK